MKTKPKVVAILQARLGSTRLPNKVLTDIHGRPMLEHIVRRVTLSPLIDTLVVATTDKATDGPIVAFSQKLGIPTFRGSEEDCLDRYYQCAQRFEADVVVRITGDNPLVDASVCDSVIQPFLATELRWDYVGNDGKPAFPLGLAAEGFTFAALEIAWREASAPRFREHVTLYLYENSQRFRVLQLSADRDYSGMRWTVDTPADLAFVQTVFGHFPDDRFPWREAVEAIEQHPEWQDLNRDVLQKAP
jgi:spore coat polysaccharide biosynthesis protein SpsF